MKGDQFHTTSFNWCFYRPFNYSKNNYFQRDPTFAVRTEERFCKNQSFEELYKLYIILFVLNNQDIMMQ